jgi:hypothetical protein
MRFTLKVLSKAKTTVGSRKYDISCAEELIQLTDEEWVPIPWLLGTDKDRPPDGQEIYNLIHDLLVSLPPITVDEDVVPIQAESECFPQIGTSIPIVREQMYKISTNQYFRVAGILLDGRVSGRHYSRGKAKGPRPRIQLDAQRSSLRRGSGLTCPFTRTYFGRNQHGESSYV